VVKTQIRTGVVCAYSGNGIDLSFVISCSYTAGIYVERESLQGRLGQCTAPIALTNDFNDALLTSAVPRVLRIYSFRKVMGAHLRDGKAIGQMHYVCVRKPRGGMNR
jgi:hypothetical protein